MRKRAVYAPWLPLLHDIYRRPVLLACATAYRADCSLVYNLRWSLRFVRRILQSIQCLVPSSISRLFTHHEFRWRAWRASPRVHSRASDAQRCWAHCVHVKERRLEEESGPLTKVARVGIQRKWTASPSPGK